MTESVTTYGDNLNIDYHLCNLLLQALNYTVNFKDAAIELGISERTLYRWVVKYKIKKGDSGFFHTLQNKNK